jgi:hypothetical protein
MMMPRLKFAAIGALSLLSLSFEAAPAAAGGCWDGGCGPAVVVQPLPVYSSCSCCCGAPSVGLGYSVGYGGGYAPGYDGGYAGVGPGYYGGYGPRYYGGYRGGLYRGAAVGAYRGGVYRRTAIGYRGGVYRRAAVVNRGGLPNRGY